MAGNVFIVNDLNFNDKDVSSLHNLSGVTIDGGEEGHTIKNLNLSDALFGDATNLTVKNLTIEGATITNGVTHVGALVNTLTGSGSFTNVTVKNANVTTTNGAAGGIVGYIKRTNDTDAGFEVTFNNCHVAGNTVTGSMSEGHFVGLLRGYDNAEVLTFNGNCTIDQVEGGTNTCTVADYTSIYREGHEATWLAGTDYSAYNGWLGSEECYRGIVNYGDSRFIPAWDGTTKVLPLKDSNNATLIWSAFDLANLQGGGHGIVLFMSDVDMGTLLFKQLSSVTTLEGNNKSIYNLYINTTNWIGGFIGSTGGTTVHRNITFVNPNITVLPSKENGAYTSEEAYAGVLCAYIEGAYTADNVHVVGVNNGAYLKGISKVGGIIGFITAACSGATVKNCTVDGLKIENEYLKLASETFPASGEIGGLIGFISANSSTAVVNISNCQVRNTHFNCCTYHYKLLNVYDVSRSVGQMIGNIRTQKGETINITSCKVSGNTYTNCETNAVETFDQASWTTGSWFSQKKYYTDLVGLWYYVFLLDKKGKVTLDGVTVFN